VAQDCEQARRRTGNPTRTFQVCPWRELQQPQREAERSTRMRCSRSTWTRAASTGSITRISTTPESRVRARRTIRLGGDTAPVLPPSLPFPATRFRVRRHSDLHASRALRSGPDIARDLALARSRTDVFGLQRRTSSTYAVCSVTRVTERPRVGCQAGSPRIVRHERRQGFDYKKLSFRRQRRTGAAGVCSCAQLSAHIREEI